MGHVSAEEYRELIRCAVDILKGNTRSAIASLEEKIRFDDRIEIKKFSGKRYEINLFKTNS